MARRLSCRSSGRTPRRARWHSAATINRGTQSEYTWCDGSGRMVPNGISDFAIYPPVSKFIEIPAGTSLTLEGTVPSIKGGFRTLQGDRASSTIEDPSDLGTVPTEPGRYALELHVALEGENNEHGSATFWFGVDAIEANGEPDAAPASSAQATGVIRCQPDGSTVVMTPRVAARADGIHIEVREVSGAGGVTVFPSLGRWSHEYGVLACSSPAGGSLAVPTGTARIACGWSDNEDPTGRHEMATSQPIEFVDPDGFDHLDELPCSSMNASTPMTRRSARSLRATMGLRCPR